jgi:hypothetical protein
MRFLLAILLLALCSCDTKAPSYGWHIVCVATDGDIQVEWHHADLEIDEGNSVGESWGNNAKPHPVWRVMPEGSYLWLHTVDGTKCKAQLEAK